MSDNTENETRDANAVSGNSQKKGRPTPKRKEAERKNYRPVVSAGVALSKAEKKEQNKRLREQRDAQWRQEQAAMRSGDEKHMPAQHRGPERRFMRDYVDARFNLAAGFMPMAFLLIASLFLQGRWPAAFAVVTVAFYVIFFSMFLDSFLIARTVRMLIVQKFGEDKVPARLTWNVLARTFYPRRWRLPKPQVKRREWPTGGTPEDVKKARAAQKKK